MRVNVRVVVPKATAHSSIIRATPRFTVVSPSVQAAYIAFSVFLDERGLHPNVKEILLASDATSLALTKAFSDSLATAEVRNFTFEKLLRDELLTSEIVAISSQKGLTDSFGLLDSTDIQANKGIKDYLNAAEAKLFDITKLLNDGVAAEDFLSAGDGLLYAYCKSIKDSVSISDVILAVREGSLDDLLGTSDQYEINTSKAFDDLFATADDHFLGFQKSLIDPVLIHEAREIRLSTGFADSFGLSDSGVISTNTYCDPTYFSEDYVGQSIYF